MSNATLRLHWDSLRQDRYRGTRPFTQEIEQAHAVLHHPFSTVDQMSEVLNLFCMNKQTCMFGRVAAKSKSIYFCIINDRDIIEGDDAVRAKIAHEQRIWKQQALDHDSRRSPHSFILVVASQKVALAAPDENLYRFSCYLQELAGWVGIGPGVKANTIASDCLYLRKPEEQSIFGFRFNVDFFAAAGDGRWWHDHRFPGGIAFSANSPGHMRQFQEWYSKAEDRAEWFLKAAMYTISHAEPTKLIGTPDRTTQESSLSDPIAEGRVTWLRDLRGGKALKDCPYPFKDKLAKAIEGKDWTTYAGLLHTDHAVRREFFEDRDTPSTERHPYNMDFTYLYDQREADYRQFMEGMPKTEGDVYSEIGQPETWGGPFVGIKPANDTGRPSEQVATIERLVEVCRRWTTTPEIEDLNFYRS